MEENEKLLVPAHSMLIRMIQIFLHTSSSILLCFAITPISLILNRSQGNSNSTSTKDLTLKTFLFFSFQIDLRLLDHRFLYRTGNSLFGTTTTRKMPLLQVFPLLQVKFSRFTKCFGQNNIKILIFHSIK